MRQKYFTVQEVAEEFKVAESTVRNWIEGGRLAAVKDDEGRWLISRKSLRKFKKSAEEENRRRYECCNEQDWEPVADFGHTAGVDFDLGRCKNCGTYLMAVYYAGSITYNILSKQQAERFLKLQGSPTLKKALRRWLDS